MQKHPFFTLHDSKETDVASFVKVILDDWCGHSRLHLIGDRRDLSANEPMAYLFVKTHWNDRLMHPHTTKGVTQRLTAAQQHWSWTAVVIWTCTVNWRGFNSLFPSFLCEQLCSTTNMNSPQFVVLILFSPPPKNPYFNSFSKADRASLYLFVTYFMHTFNYICKTIS